MDQEQHYNMQPLEYEPSYLNSYSFRDQYAPMTVGQWSVVIVVSLIPGLNLLLFLFWSFAGSMNKNLQNFSRAILLILLSGLLLSGLTAGIFRLLGKSFIF